MTMLKDFYKGVDLPKYFDKDLVKRAYIFAKNAHKNQKRKSGDPYISHPLAVARILLELKMSPNVIAAALLHDTVEDTDVTIESIKKEFGDDIAYLVEAVTKLRSVDFSLYSNPAERKSNEVQKKNEDLRKLFLSMAEDVRVVIIKLADRLHNMRTIKALPRKDQRRIAIETLNIFAPLALRLGMGEIKGMLEDLAFPIAYPEEYKKLKKEANQRYKAADRYVLFIKRIISDELKKAGIKADIHGRAKHIYSLYKKITRPEINWDFNKIYDLVALRIITDKEEDCYKALGVIHKKFRPLPNYVRDYIAAPKPNGYRSIHTTIFGPDEKMVEIQIRTWEMHEEAEYGVASHLHYTLEKTSGKSDEQLEKGVYASKKQTDFLKRIKEWQASIGSDEEFVEGLKLEFLDDRIYVFSPAGDIFDLPVGATPIDFAYEVHSDIGNTCVGAKVNGKIVSLDTPLKTRDVVEVITNKNSNPKRGWLDFVKTSKARQSIRSYFRKFEYDKNKEDGEKILTKELDLLNYSLEDIPEAELKESITENTSYKTIDDFLAAIGEGIITKKQAVKIALGKNFIPSKNTNKSSMKKKSPMTRKRGDIKFKIASCCSPNKNDEVISYISRGEGLIVHKKDCKNVKGLEKSRLSSINPLRSEAELEKSKLVKIEVVASDRVGLIRDLSTVIADFGYNIEKLDNLHLKGEEENRFLFEIEYAGIIELANLLEKLKEVDSVKSVRRFSE